MRLALLAFLALPAFAHADTREPKKFPRTTVWKNTVKNKGAVAAFTPVSHTLYLNDCKPNGCIVKPGNDNSKTNTSSIPSNQRTLAAFPYPYWDELVACVKDTFAPFDINIVTTDPGNANHFEVMVGGTATALSPDLQGAGGVAPFIDCSTTTDNVISFVFAQEVNDLEFLCGAVAQEAAHVWGLDHELDADDPMTYLDLGTSKRFQDVSARCGEELTNANGAGPRDCFCGDPTQNSFQFLSNTFDNSNIGPASAGITSPTNGQYVRAGFPIRATLDSPLQYRSGQLKADGTVVGEINESLAIALPASVPAGDRMLTVSLTDTGSRTASASVMVHVIGSCAAGCAAGTACINDLCVPNGVDGGLGDTCTTNEECLTGTCASDGTLSACTGSCDNGACPSGFECLSSNICWPESSSGGCATGGNSAGFLLIGLGFAVVLLRRRHRN